MYIKCCIFVIVVMGTSIIESFGDFMPCSLPSLTHGRVRVRQKMRLAKFMCSYRYELVGNTYATCRDGQWDVQMPVCVMPGCVQPKIENGIFIPTRRGAWLLVFCSSGHRLVGSPVLYCDGYRWNDTAPTCVDTTVPPSLSCDFEDSSLCQWTQDELHDFDWRQINRKTPSSFLFTGPSFDHTYGEGGSGYYMYIESTSRMENDSARLISPVYGKEHSKNACFSFYYHMFGNSIGGLRVYQKPENLSLSYLLDLNAEVKKKYLLFEKWGNQGNIWYGSVTNLTDFNDDFQIVVEGIRGISFTSDIAIDDVAILHGDKCNVTDNAVTTATPNTESCAGRCDLFGEQMPRSGCGCTRLCVAESDCCIDFFDECVFTGTTDESFSTLETITKTDSPQTEKLVAIKSTIPNPKNTEAPPPTTKTASATTKPTPTTTAATTIAMVTTKRATTPPNATKTVETITVKMTDKPTVNVTAKDEDFVSRTFDNHNRYHEIVEKAKAGRDGQEKEDDGEVKANKVVAETNASASKSESSSGLKTAAIIVGVLMCIGACAYIVVALRRSRGINITAGLMGRSRRDSQVRYLTREEEIDEDF